MSVIFHSAGNHIEIKADNKVVSPSFLELKCKHNMLWNYFEPEPHLADVDKLAHQLFEKCGCGAAVARCSLETNARLASCIIPHPTRHLQLFDDEQLTEEIERRGLVHVLHEKLHARVKELEQQRNRACDERDAARLTNAVRPIRVVVESHVRPLRIPNADAFQFVCPDGTKVEVATEAIKAALLLEVESIQRESVAEKFENILVAMNKGLIYPTDAARVLDPLSTMPLEAFPYRQWEDHRKQPYGLKDCETSTLGIASIPKPDNSHYVLDVDLLADDA